MLVLTRKLGERIVVGDSIIISIVRIEHDKVRIGIEAPRDVPILREEVRNRTRAPAGPALRPGPLRDDLPRRRSDTV